MSRLNILLLHAVRDVPESPSDISTATLRSCLDLIQCSQIPVVRLDECDTPQGKQDALGLTFDDGWVTDAKVVLPELTRRNLPGTFFVITDKVGKPDFLSWTQLREMANGGMEIGSHTRSHPNLLRISEGAAYEEFRASREEVEERLGRQVIAVSIPHGFYNRRLLDAARKAGYRWIYSSRPGINRLPLQDHAPIRRNALHRYMTVTDLSRILRPHSRQLMQRQAAYMAREALKGSLGEDRYVAFRNWALRLSGRKA